VLAQVREAPFAPAKELRGRPRRVTADRPVPARVMPPSRASASVLVILAGSEKAFGGGGRHRIRHGAAALYGLNTPFDTPRFM